MKQLAIGLCLSMSALSSAPAFAQAPEALALELVRLRGEVDAVASALSEKRDARSGQIRALAAQKASVEAELRREELRLRQLEQALAAEKTRVEGAGRAEAELLPVVLDAAERLEKSLDHGVPFRVEDRRAELDRIKKDLNEGLLLPSAGITRLWAWVEDELRQSRESGLHQQVIPIDEREVLADVVRVGMVALYFRTPEGRFGLARKLATGGYRYEELPDETSSKQVAKLFESMERRIRAGFFELPNPEPGVSGRAAEARR